MAGSKDPTADPTPEAAVTAQTGAPRHEGASPFSEAFAGLDTAHADATGAGAPDAPQPVGRNIDAMLNVDLRVQVILGHARMPISRMLKLSRGSVIELDRKIGEPVDVVINDRLVARGDLVKLSEDRIGVTLTEIIKDYVLDT